MINSNLEVTLNDTALLTRYYNEVKAELNEILTYWMRKTHDTVNGGFTGHIDENNRSHPEAPKGAVLNARILWTFSAAYQLTNDPQHLHLARMAFNYLSANFSDKKHGGIYWTVNAKGQPLDTKKQIYALAFAIYGCSAYFQVSNNEAARVMAIDLYRQIEKYSFDTVNTGYLEAFTREWQPLNDLRLSAKDANEKKTMNTHLHILEAYTVLYRAWPDDKLREQIKRLLQNFQDHIVDAESGHLILFFDEQWNTRSATVSYGHDIEAAWLLLEAAEAIADHSVINTMKELCVKIAEAAAGGLDKDGGLWYEYETGSRHLIKEKHWWVQAEAMVGFLNTWRLTNDKAYLERSLKAWKYTRAFIKDKVYGEWLWGRNDDGTPMKGQDKVGIWKCPYHNSRACMEIIRRLQPLLQQ